MPAKKQKQLTASQDKPVSKKKTGRPTKYSKPIIDEILIRIVEGESLNKILKDERLPCMATVFSWLTDDTKPEFLDKYNKAKELQAEYYADELIDIADDAANDYQDKVLATGEVVQIVNSEHIQRSRLRVDTRKWVAAKLLPKRYGDKQELAVTTEPSEQLKEIMDMVKPTLGPPAYRKK